MHGSTRGLISGSGPGRLWLVALCVCGAALSTASYADQGRHRGEHAKFRGQHSEWNRGRHADRRHDERHDSRHEDRHSWNRSHWNHGDRRGWHRSDSRNHAWYFGGHRDLRLQRHGSDWRYYRGRYWAPAYYRGRRCNDPRHFHGVHYHVAVRDYYDYYYPRYRYYGPRPLGANASVIISIPLF